MIGDVCTAGVELRSTGKPQTEQDHHTCEYCHGQQDNKGYPVPYQDTGNRRWSHQMHRRCRQTFSAVTRLHLRRHFVFPISGRMHRKFCTKHHRQVITKYARYSPIDMDTLTHTITTVHTQCPANATSCIANGGGFQIVEFEFEFELS